MQITIKKKWTEWQKLIKIVNKEKVDFSKLYVALPTNGEFIHYDSMDAAKAAGAVTINYGLFINTLISFVIVAFAVCKIRWRRISCGGSWGQRWKDLAKSAEIPQKAESV